MEMKRLARFIRFVLFLPYTIYFNFKCLPYKQAIKLPIVFYVRPTFLSLKGKVILDCQARRNMIRLGLEMAPMVTYSGFRWKNLGTIIFKGDLTFSYKGFISCGEKGCIEFGNNNSFSFGCRVICEESIVFADKIRVSWDCTFIDTDFHPIIDTVSNRPLKMTFPINLRYGVWIGHNCIISKGCKILENSIVSSGAIVKGKFSKENVIIAGNPAVVVDEGYVRDDV